MVRAKLTNKKGEVCPHLAFYNQIAFVSLSFVRQHEFDSAP